METRAGVKGQAASGAGRSPAGAVNGRHSSFGAPARDCGSRCAMKGQYFSFDAIIATVMMVVAVTSLAAYWFGVQSVVESRNNPLYSDALRISESLLSPGTPSDWEKKLDVNEIRQIGLAAAYSSELNKTKINRLASLASPFSDPSYYGDVGRIMRSGGEYYVLIEQTDDKNGLQYAMGRPYPDNATEVVVAHRGAMIVDNGIQKPVRVRVFVWR